MDDDRLKQVIQSEIHSATGSLLGSDGGGDLADRRREALEFYYSEPFGNEIDGRSQAIDSVVHDTVEAALPSLLDPFVSTDDVAHFIPQKPSDEPFAKQATEYINYILTQDNDRFSLFHAWFKDALIQKNGIIKVWWDDSESEERFTYTGLNLQQVTYLLDDPDVEPIEKDIDEETGLIDLAIIRKIPPKIMIKGLPPEEFLIARRAVSIEDAAFVAHRVRKTISELIEEGYDPEVLERIPSYEESEYNEERLARFEADDEWPIDANHMDPAMRSVWVYECYVKTDYDGDGLTELRQVVVAGPGYDLLSNVPVDEVPFVSITPIPLPHKFFGLSLADETMDLQLIKSTILRQLLDNMYLVNNNELLANERVELDDLLTRRPGGVIRVMDDLPIGDSVTPVITQSIGSFAYPLLEYMDALRENRTGITRYNQGMDADSLNKTATGIDRIMAASQKRQQLISRVFAETGVKPLMKKVLRLVVKNQDQKRVIRLRDEWIEMDPKVWNANMDVRINVGLGHGTKEQELAALNQMANVDAGIIQLQGGADGPIITWEEIYNAKKRFSEAAGLRNAEQFAKDPTKGPRPQKGPSPAEVEAQVREKEFQEKNQLEREKLALDDKQHQEELAFKQQELLMKTELEAQKANVEMDTKNREVSLKETEQRGTAAGQLTDQISRAEAMAQNAADALQQAASQFEGIVDRVSRLEEIISAPKNIQIVRENGRVVGAVTEQAGMTTESRLN